MSGLSLTEQAASWGNCCCLFCPTEALVPHPLQAALQAIAKQETAISPASVCVVLDTSCDVQFCVMEVYGLGNKSYI